MGWRIYPRHRLDLTAGHLARALLYCLTAREEGDWVEDALCCVSLRSGFDLLLEALALEPGAEVAVSAVTHPDMVRILERHGLVPVPVDIEEATMAPDAAALEAAITPRTRAILVAHLFGGRVDIAPIAALARGRGILLFEDCAQSFRGPHDRGDEAADISMFSFGAIKTCPALGGGLMYVRNPELLARMRSLHAGRPRQRRRDYAARIVRFSALCALQSPVVYGAFVRLAAVARIDADRLVNGAVHALRPPSADDADAFGRWLRRRPSEPLVALLRHRLRTFDASRLERRASRGEELARSLAAALSHPGRDALDRTHWVFPVLATNPTHLIRRLRAAGFDATVATSSIGAVGAPPRAAELMRRIVFVPAYPEIPRPAFDRLARLLGETP